jgi:L-alanine-DL-glutamate epimerase-like enolase superfamily enzyme
MSNQSEWISKDFGAFKLRFRPYTLTLRHVFTVASYSRNTTPVVLTELEYDGIIGYGEASMPPYLGESQESVIAFLNQIDLSGFSSPFQTEEILHYVDQVAAKNTAAKAAIDIALHDVLGKIMGQAFL